MGKLEGRVAFITGAARGQGRSHALRLAEEGADIIAVDICEQLPGAPYEMATEADLQETADQVAKLDRRIVPIKADVRSRTNLDKAVKHGVDELGRLDVVVANAGYLSSAPFVEMTDEAYHEMIDVQMHGMYYTCKATVPQLIEQGSGGSIIIISSIAGFRGFPDQVHYNMAKHAVVGLMRSLANELAPYDIRANSIHPSSVIPG